LGISATFGASTKKLTLTSQISGDVTLVLKTTNVEKVLKFYVNRVTPTQLNAAVYEYNDSGYNWNNNATKASVYVGQTLTLKAVVPSNEQAYVEKEYAVNVTSSNFENVELSYSDDGELTYFVASKAGTYTLKLSGSSNTVSVTLTVTVTNPPAVSSLLSGTYTGTLKYSPRGAVSVTFKGGNTLEVTVGNQTETLSYTVDGSTLITEHKSGVELGFSLTINEAYKLVLSHSTGFDDEVESVVLNKSE
jgi:hypothetical protein